MKEKPIQFPGIRSVSQPILGLSLVTKYSRKKMLILLLIYTKSDYLVKCYAISRRSSSLNYVQVRFFRPPPPLLIVFSELKIR